MNQELAPHIDFIIHAHRDLSKTPQKSVRLWDKETPYYIHPLWCATSILTETALPEDVRQEGAVALLYHDILEDTNAELPQGLSPHIREFIHDMTFQGGMTQEMEEIWKKDPKVRLFKLFDKISNLLDGTWMSSELREKYIAHTKRLLQDVEQNFGDLNIVKIAHSIID